MRVRPRMGGEEDEEGAKVDVTCYGLATGGKMEMSPAACNCRCRGVLLVKAKAAAHVTQEQLPSAWLRVVVAGEAVGDEVAQKRSA